MEAFTALFWLIVAFSAIIVIAKFSNRKTEQNNENNYKKNSSTTSNDQPLEQPNVKLRSRPRNNLFAEFSDGIKEKEFEYDYTDIQNDLENLIEYMNRYCNLWIIAFENESYSKLSTELKKCCKFEVSVFLLFEFNLLMVVYLKTPCLIRDMVNKYIYQHIKHISPHITNSHIEKRLNRYHDPLEWLYIDEDIYEKTINRSVNLLCAFLVRAYQNKSLLNTIEIYDDEDINYSGSTEAPNAINVYLSDMFQEMKNYLNMLQINKDYKKEIPKSLDRIDKYYLDFTKDLINTVMLDKYIDKKKYYKFECAVFMLFQFDFFTKYRREKPLSFAVKNARHNIISHIVSIGNCDYEGIKSRLDNYLSMMKKTLLSEKTHRYDYDLFFGLMRRLTNINNWNKLCQISKNDNIELPKENDNFSEMYKNIDEKIVVPMIAYMNVELTLIEKIMNE